MAEEFLRDHPRLRSFVLSDVQLTGTELGSGAYGKVEEIVVPLCAAAKTIHPFLQEAKASTEFVRECQLMSSLSHPNIVKFLGVAFFPGSRLPALVMERLLTSLHDLLDPDPDPSPLSNPTPVSMALKCSILHNVACGLAYLHGRLPPIIHRDLSARNVLLDFDMVGKITDLGVARTVPRLMVAATMTKGPGASVYMPPEASAPAASNTQMSKYDASIDVFSFGVVTIFTIGEKFPCDPLPHTYADEKTGLLQARTELQRRSNYMRYVNNQLRAFHQLYAKHPLILLIQQCLQNFPSKRPDIREVLCLLEQARGCFNQEECERNKLEVLQSIQSQPRDQNLACVLQDLKTVNADLQAYVQAKERELAQAHQQLILKEERLQISERERQDMDRELADVNHKLTQKEEELIGKQVQLTQTEAELTRAQEILKRQQQEMEEMMSPASYVSRVSGPGLISATVNKPTHLFVKLTQSSGRACTLQVDVTAQLDFVSQDRVAGKSSVRHKIDIPVVMKSPSQYEMSYTAQSRGQRKIHVHVNNIEIDGSPFTVTVYPDPSHLGRPVKIVTGLTKPFGIAFNNQQCMIVSELGGHQLTLFDTRGHKIMTFGTYGGNPEQMIYPTGVVTDRSDNVYVSSEHKLQKFNSSGVFIKGTGQMGKREGEFYDPCGATLYNNTLYVCDAHNHRIQVFDLDLNFFRSIGTYGNGSGQFDKPLDVKFDIAGNMYVADFGNERLQVMDADGNFISAFGQEGEGKLRGPSAVHIADMYVYVSDWRGDCINVYETSGNFITSFGKHGEKEGDFRAPYCITSCADGYIYVCDNGNYRVQIF